MVAGNESPSTSNRGEHARIPPLCQTGPRFCCRSEIGRENGRQRTKDAPQHKLAFACELCIFMVMADTSIHRRRGSLWLGLVVCLVGALSNVFYFLNPPVQVALPWINLLMPIGGLAIVVFGLWRAYARPEDCGGRVLGPVFAIVCLVLAGGSTLGFFHARDVPGSARAPRVGQKAPDFPLADSEGRMVSLSQLLAGSGEKAGPPKSVLLIFYRGYW